jgi:hypothetical protein
MIKNKILFKSFCNGYLCGDGYVITNPRTQKHKYYHIGFRNTNVVLIKDFQSKFRDVFGISPIITNEGRCRIGNKEIYYFLTKDFSYDSYHWEFPQLSRENVKYWLRAFFDCEGWFENQPAKSRLVGLDCCNKSGVLSVQQALASLGIKSQVKRRVNRTIWRIAICGLDDLKLFQKQVDFLHPAKKKKLHDAISSYVDYIREIPLSEEGLMYLVMEKGRFRQPRNELRLSSINKQKLTNLSKALKKHNINSRLLGPWKSRCSQYYCLIINKEDLHERKNSRASSGDQ